MKKQQKTEQIHDRIALVIKTLKYDVPSFARKIGVSRPALVSVISKKEDPSYAMIKNITQILPVSQEWLFMGHGKPWTTGDLSSHMAHAKADDNHRDVSKDINSRVKIVRMQSSYTQALFAAELKISRDVITGIETFRTSPSAALIRRVCLTFGVNPNWIILGEGDMESKSA